MVDIGTALAFLVILGAGVSTIISSVRMERSMRWIEGYVERERRRLDAQRAARLRDDS